jgi:hypothetical protein
MASGDPPVFRVLPRLGLVPLHAIPDFQLRTVRNKATLWVRSAHDPRGLSQAPCHNFLVCDKV